MNRLDPLALDLVGTSLIEASAGTGKTYTITTLYLRLLLERGLAVSEVLVVTYTRAATAELRDRIRKRIADALYAFEVDDADGDVALAELMSRLSGDVERKRALGQLTAALAGFDEAAILTIHGFCQRVLHENAFESRASFRSELLVDERGLLNEIVGDYWATAVAEEPESFIRFLVREKTTVASLVTLAMRAGGVEPFRLLPEAQDVDTSALERCERAFHETFESVRKAWRSVGAQALELVRKAAEEKQLSGSVYRLKTIEGTWSLVLEELFADAAPGAVAACRPFECLTPGLLKSKTNKGKTTPEHAFFEMCADLWAADQELCSLLAAKKLNFQRELVETVASESAARKEQNGQQTYDDLLRQVGAALASQAGGALAGQLREKMPAALVDEFQDTDRLQYQILRRIWHEEGAFARADELGGGDDEAEEAAEGKEGKNRASSLFLIGDPKQAIYAFRGADVHTYLSAKRDVKGRSYTLDTNWRSDPSMVAAANTLFQQVEVPFRLEEIPFEPVLSRPEAEDELIGSHVADASPAALDIVFFARDDDKPVTKERANQELPWRVAADIAGLLRSDVQLEGRAIRSSDIAVLCRSNIQAHDLCGALRDVGVPAALLGSASVFDSEEAIDVERLLDAIAEPGSTSRVRAALTTRLLGLAGRDIEQLDRDEAAWDEWLLRFQGWNQSWKRRGFVRMFHQMLRDAGVHVRLLGYEDGERRLTNYLHLCELVEQATLSNHLGPRGSVEWLSSMRVDRSLRENVVGEEGELRLESDAEAVKVVTVHKSKGLEYPIVYCPYLWDSSKLRDIERRWPRFHDASDREQMVLDLGSEDHEAHRTIAEEEAAAEGMRLLYVALTRAKHRCTVVWGNIKDAETSSLASLLHPAEQEETTEKDSKPQSLKGMSDQEMNSALLEFVGRSDGTASLRALGREPARREESAADGREFFFRKAKRRVATHWRHSSFSNLAASAHGAQYHERGVLDADVSRGQEDGLDYDAVPEAVPNAMLEGVEGEFQDTAEVLLNPFPAGAAAGTFLHSILEHLDFEKPALEQSRDIVGESLEAHGFEASWRGLLGSAIDEIVGTPWHDDGPSLAQLSRATRIDEMEFLLPVASRSSGERAAPAMTVEDLARVFAQHAKSDLQREYAERLRGLNFEALAGYLKGYIDLVFEWRGRYYIVDYKSNHLGPTASRYLPSQLEVPMVEYHYVLQYHIYTVALHQYLALRLPDYDYERHFGGAYYLFLRGMKPSHPAGVGVYSDRPDEAFVTALTTLFVGESGEPGGAS